MKIFSILILVVGLLHAGKTTFVTIDNAVIKAKATFSITDEKGALIGRGLRWGLLPPYNYTIFDPEGRTIATAESRLFAFGALAAGSENLDIYTPDGYLGKISGTIWTFARAKFRFSDRDDHECALAYLDNDRFVFSIVEEQELNNKLLMTLEGVATGTSGHIKNTWIEGAPEIDERIIHIFSMFVLDFRYSFTHTYY
ncbi:MAG: hypothetical protein A3F09_01335 [Chlamydiae bacterium RIFCSPHIGHO2_12_FULL_49_11]|nr:MAG: hypothetical protein A3F09_01335 [Chlamydiae bacterium RIFCSPHIGHO2_12_FULL_49_11]